LSESCKAQKGINNRMGRIRLFSGREPAPKVDDKKIVLRWGYLLMSLLLCFCLCVVSGCANKEKQAEKHFKKGFQYQAQGNPDKALEEYQKALDVDPHYVQAYTNMGAVYLGMKDFDRAIENFKKVIELNYWDKKAHYNLGMAYLYQGELEKAEAEVAFLKSLNSDLARALERKIVEREPTP
jgi:tetratricopeptide (TPR) repeat protein